jgi:hypothetical protein
MKRLKIIAVIILMPFLICFVIKSQIRLVKLSDRTEQLYSTDIDCGDIHLSSVKDIAEYSKKKTAEKLSFAKHNDISSGQANCVGYAQYAADLCNKLFKCNNINAKAKPVVGCYYFRNTNIHEAVVKLFSNQQIINFIKDHDYVEIVNSSGEVVYSFDPSIYDLTYLNFHE